MQKFTKLPADAFTHLQLNAGILVDTFEPATGVIGNIMGATSGGVNFSSNPEFSDFGEDVDNCPANTKQLKHLDQHDATMSGTFLTCTPSGIASLLAAADVDGTDTTKVVPRGFQIQSGKNAKGTMSFEYHAHYDLTNMDEVPFEIFCKEGAA